MSIAAVRDRYDYSPAQNKQYLQNTFMQSPDVPQLATRMSEQ